MKAIRRLLYRFTPARRLLWMLALRKAPKGGMVHCYLEYLLHGGKQ